MSARTSSARARGVRPRPRGHLVLDAQAVYAAYRILATAGGAPAARERAAPPRSTASSAVPETLSFSGRPAIDAAGRSSCSTPRSRRSRATRPSRSSTGPPPALRRAARRRPRPVAWEVAPGTPRRVSRLDFTGGRSRRSIAGRREVTVYVRRPPGRRAPLRVPGAHRRGQAAQLRLYPAPAAAPEQIAVRHERRRRPSWEVLACRDAAAQESPEGDVPVGRDRRPRRRRPPADAALQAPASANLARVRHGTTRPRGARQRRRDAGPGSALDDARRADRLRRRRAGTAGARRWPSRRRRALGRGAEPVRRRTGRGVRRRASPPTAASPSSSATASRAPACRPAAATSRRPTASAAARRARSARARSRPARQRARREEGRGRRPDERRRRPGRRAATCARSRPAARAPSGARSRSRTSSTSPRLPGRDARRGLERVGTAGCACGGSGLHLAFLRARPGRAAGAARAGEIAALAGFLDARRDATVPLCVCAGCRRARRCGSTSCSPSTRGASRRPRSRPPPRALLDPDGAAGARPRAPLGQPLDRSDVYAVLHGAPGVVGRARASTSPARTGELEPPGGRSLRADRARSGARRSREPA